MNKKILIITLVLFIAFSMLLGNGCMRTDNRDMEAELDRLEEEFSNTNIDSDDLTDAEPAKEEVDDQEINLKGILETEIKTGPRITYSVGSDSYINLGPRSVDSDSVHTYGNGAFTPGGSVQLQGTVENRQTTKSGDVLA